MDAAERSNWANAILDAHAERVTLSAISEDRALSIEDAYAIQGLILDARLRRGERQVGWKLGYTSEAMRAQMGVGSPNLGPLTDAMLLADGEAISDRLTQPRVEPEIAVRLRSAVPPRASRAQVSRALESAHAALEVVDSVWRDYRFRLEDNTADGSSAAQVVLGSRLPVDALDQVSVRMVHNGHLIAESTGAAAMGHPLDAVAWLATELDKSGVALRPGDLIITGGLTAAEPLRGGDVIEATFAGTVSVRTHRNATAT